ncbi:Predicted transcriptional regulator, contains HTH domain [Halogeometricum rufum]|uniref:Predicted transcriptional regulator, contains HTH domain n=2 Tax=Halogeometricum rufum TaxID=553469 RepID=A0A1I6JAC5_9EURY|nr:Predicted transcriptional regulator, contains HTH domain [Halogeometricum rufum]
MRSGVCDDMDGEDLTELLRLRHDVLGALADDPRPRHELVDALPDSKSTVYKGLSQLQEAGLVVRDDDGFRPTLFGTVALARYDALADTARFGDMLADVPGDAVDPAALVGATVVRPDETDAERHVEAVWTLLGDAERARAVAPVVSPGYVARFRELLDAGLTAELVLPESVAASLRDEYPDELAAISERAALYETTAPVPFGVLVTEGARPQMAIELRDGPLVSGLITNDTPAAIRWAEATVDRFRTNAVRLDAP